MKRSFQVAFLPVVLACFSLPTLAQDAPTPPEGMVLVPAGDFLMGTNDSDRTDFNQRDNVPLNANDARPQHLVKLPTFFIDKFEVTNAQYKKYCDATSYPVPPSWKNGKYTDGQDDYPVNYVNFYEATAYAKWVGKRLPTEAEWEKADRGTDGRRYPWGNDWRAGTGNTDSGVTEKIGGYPLGASPYGALDMAGNVMEWTSSWFDAYPGSPTQQPDFGKKNFKVVRGGATYDGQGMSESWYRAVMRPQARTIWTGIRCVMDVK